MKTLIIILCFYTATASAQKESPFEIKDKLLKVGLFHNLKLSNKLSLQNGAYIRKNVDFVTLEIPFLIKYDHSNKWSTFFGYHAREVVRSNFPEIYDIEKPARSNIFIGTEYDFKNNSTGNFSIGFPLDVQLGLKF